MSSHEIFRDNEKGYSYATRLYEMFPLDFCPLEAPPSPTKSMTATPPPAQQAVFQLFCQQPTPLRRLRPEFIKQYPHALCSDALTEWCAYSRREKEQNDYELTRASRYLRETWIPAFVKRLDVLEIRPIDSRHLSLEMHRAGVNMRYLGMHDTLKLLFYRTCSKNIQVALHSRHVLYRNGCKGIQIHL